MSICQGSRIRVVHFVSIESAAIDVIARKSHVFSLEADIKAETQVEPRRGIFPPPGIALRNTLLR